MPICVHLSLDYSLRRLHLRAALAWGVAAAGGSIAGAGLHYHARACTDQFLDHAFALGAGLYRRFEHAVEFFKLMAALAAFVFIRGHEKSP